MTSQLEGAKLPNVAVYEDSPDNKVYINEIFSGKKGVLLGIMGAYTPVCSTSHVPGFIQNLDQLKSKGYEVVAVISVNDPYVTGSWKKACNAQNKCRILADPEAEFTKAIGMQNNLPLYGTRCKRFTMLIDNNVIKKCFVEPDGTGATVTQAENVLKNL